jgi:hypothetical protein
MPPLALGRKPPTSSPWAAEGRPWREQPDGVSGGFGEPGDPALAELAAIVNGGFLLASDSS